MSLGRKIIAMFRTAVASTRSSAGWERDLAMLQYRESDLPRAAEKGHRRKEHLSMREGS